MTEPKTLSAEVDTLKAALSEFIASPIDLTIAVTLITISLVEQQQAGWRAGYKVGKALANVSE